MLSAKKKFFLKIAVSIVITFAVMTVIFAVSAVNVYAQEKQQAVAAAQGSPAAPETIAANADAAAKAEVTKMALIAAAVAFGLGAIGAGIAVGNVGSAAMGAIGEKPEIFGQAIVFVGLAEGIMVFGFIIALLILNH